MGDVAYVADAVNRSSQALREAELLVSAENVGLSLIGRACQRVQGLLEVAERAVGQQKRRQEDLTRFRFAREENNAHRRLRREYKDKLKAKAESAERIRMATELRLELVRSARKTLAPRRHMQRSDHFSIFFFFLCWSFYMRTSTNDTKSKKKTAG